MRRSLTPTHNRPGSEDPVETEINVTPSGFLLCMLFFYINAIPSGLQYIPLEHSQQIKKGMVRLH